MLRTVRQTAVDKTPNTILFGVRDATTAKLYQLFVRDELPDADDMAFDAFMKAATAP